MKKVLIVGGTSAMAEACARIWAQRGDALFLAARNEAQLNSVVDDLRTRGAHKVGSKVFDANDFERHAELLAEATAFMGGFDTVLIAHGTLSDQARAQTDQAYAIREISTNGLSVVSLMGLAGEQLAKQGHGAVAVISSVAGDRGRQSNYVYGSAKAMVSAFASGMRQRLSKQGVHIITIKPGFVDSPMTAGFKKGALWAKPEQVAKDITRSIDKGHSIVYTPGFWRLIMLIIKHIPEAIFVRLSL